MWRCELVNADQTRVAAIGGLPEKFDRSAMAVESYQVTVAVDSEAGQAIIAAPVLPLLEVQVWRGARCVVSGPIVNAPVDFQSGQITVQCRGALHHLDRTLTGPAALENLAPNPLLETDLTGWNRWLTTFDEISGVAWETFDEDVTQITWVASGATDVPNAPVAGANWVRFAGDELTVDEELQLYHDEIVEASDLAPIRVTVRACWWIAPRQDFGPPDPGEEGRTNLDHAMIATVHSTAGDFSEPAPIGYFQFEPILSVTRWGDLFAGRYEDLECTVEIPQGTGEWRIHLAMVPPRLEAFVTLVEINIDRPIDLAGTATGRFGDLIDHAQDPAFGHVDRRIAGSLIGAASTVVDEEAIMESDRRTVLQALNQASDAGQIEWRTVYAGDGRTIEYGVPPQGAQLNLPLTITDSGGSGHVAACDLQRMWGSGSTVVTGQSSRGQTRSDVAAAVGSDELAWEEVFVAPDWVARWGLAEWVSARLAETSHPEALEVTFDPDHQATEPWRDGTVDVLDRVPLAFDRDGTVLSGWWQVRQITLDPASDGVAAVLVPEVS